MRPSHRATDGPDPLHISRICCFLTGPSKAGGHRFRIPSDTEEHGAAWPGDEAFLTERFLLGSRYCRGVWGTQELLFDSLRSAHTPDLFCVTAHLATAHRWQWDCCTVDTLTCPGRKLTGRITDWCIPFVGAPAVVHAGHHVSLPTCLFCLTGQNVNANVIKEIPVTSSRSYKFVAVRHLVSTSAGVCSVGFPSILFSLCLCSSLLHLTTMGRATL